MTDGDTGTRQIETALLERLGLIVTRWTLIEKLIAELFAATVGGDRGALYVVTENISTSTLTDWVRTAIKSRPMSPVTDRNLLDLLSEIDGLRAERNVLVHGL